MVAAIDVQIVFIITFIFTKPALVHGWCAPHESHKGSGLAPSTEAEGAPERGIRAKSA